MDSYKSIITPDAEADLIEIRNYIAFSLHVPNVALHYIRNIRTEIGKLSYMANSIAPVHNEPWHSRGIRKITVKAFFVYYRINEPTKTVYIMNVIYSRRDQLMALQHMNIEE